jgi:hypothetical protein
VIDAHHFRLFSEGVRVAENEKEAKQRRLMGGEIDSPSRNVARLVAELTDATLPDFHGKLVYRADRMGRGGDQGPMQEAGFTAIRITESAENYHRQHQDLRQENGVAYGDVAAGVNIPYLTAMTRVNVIALADMAWAPAPPPQIEVDGAVSSDTTLSWTEQPGAVGYEVRWRDTTAAMWQNKLYLDNAVKAVLTNKVVDDYSFGVASVSKQGYVSPTSFASARKPAS